MSFYYINPGLIKSFNYFTDENMMSQINSEIHNPNCKVACTSSSSFGYYFNETVSTISGRFSLYVMTNSPLKNIFSINFYNLPNVSYPLGDPIFSIKGYPEGSTLNNDYFPLSFNVGKMNVYITDDINQFPQIAFLNQIWFRLSVDSQKVATLELKINNHPIYCYTFDFNVDYLGNALIFTLNDSSISNILLSSNYNDVKYYNEVVTIPFTVSESDMLQENDSYIVQSNIQHLVLNVSESSYDNMDNIYCFLSIDENKSESLNSVLVDINNVYDNKSLSSHFQQDISDSIITIPVSEYNSVSSVLGDYSLSIRFNSLSSISAGD